MHQPRQRGQVGHVEIVRLVQHQVAGHEAQHGRDLAAAAQALGGGRQMVHGASQHGRGNQRANLGIVGQTLQQRMPVVAFEQNLPAFVEQRLARGRARRLGPDFPVFEQGAAGGAADLDGQLLIAQAQIPLKHAPCLQGQCAQANGECAAHAHARVGQGIHDAGIAQRLAAAGRGHVDDERTLALRALTHAGGQVGRLVLPLESWIGIALFRPR